MISREYVPENSAKVIKKAKPVAKKVDTKVEKKADIKKVEIKPKLKFFPSKFGGIEMTVLEKNGNSVKGIVAEEESGFIKLINIVITNKTQIIEADYIWIERCQIAHLTPKPSKITNI